MRHEFPAAMDTAPSGEENDQALIARFAATGDRRAFETLARRHLPAIRRFLALRLADQAEVLEAEQEVLIRLFRSLPSFRGDSGLRTWLFRLCSLTAADLVRNKALERSRRAILARGLPDADPRPADEPSFGLEREEGAAAVRSALVALGEPEASLVYLRDAEGLSVAELAECFSLREGTVKSRLSRARARLRVLLENAEPCAPGSRQ